MNRGLLMAGLAVGGYHLYRALKPRYSFKNRHVVITGGARGLGLVLARQLADAGARLTICNRDSAEVESAAAELRERGAEVYARVCDVAKADDLRAWLDSARRWLGPVDMLIHNAGIIQAGPIEAMTEADFRDSLAIHFWSSYHATMHLLPEMKSRGQGRIVNIASVGGKIAVPHLVPYAAGKFALVGLSDGLRSELAKDGIVVTTVCPGLMRTGSHLKATFKGRHEEEYAWFAASNAAPGISMSAERAAAKILDACALGDAEVVLGASAKLGVVMRALAPNLTQEILTLVNGHVLPEPGGIGTQKRSGHQSRGQLPETVTTFTDQAAVRNNETRTVT